MDTKPTIKNFIIVILPAVLTVFVIFVLVMPKARENRESSSPDSNIQVTNFAECVLAGNPVMESYPRQCRHEGELFVEDIGNELDKTDIIRLNSPGPNELITSPLAITGEARGTWFFEASFPVVLTDWDGLIIAQGIATTLDDPAQGGLGWMTEDFVPFEATLTFEPDKNAYSNRGALILQKDNPSGLAENDDALEIPILFGEVLDADSAWLAIKQDIQNCEVKSIMQAHSLQVSAELKDGTTLRAVEPSIDDIIDVAVGAEDRCGGILMGTE